MRFMIPAVGAIALQAAVPLAVALTLPREPELWSLIRFLVGVSSVFVALPLWWLALRAAKHRAPPEEPV